MINRKFAKDEFKDEKIDAPCRRCKLGTKHGILSEVRMTLREETPDTLIYGSDDKYQIIQCQGCETLSFRTEHTNSEDEKHYETPEGYGSEWAIHEEYFPNPVDGRAGINDYHLLPKKLRGIYKETLAALNAGHPVLTGIGIRAIVETVCNDNDAPGRDLYKKIAGLVTQGVLTQAGADILHKLRTLGNDAAHNVKPHDNIQLGLAFDVIDHLLQGVYILPHHAAETL
jgi:hypothetical protein